MEQLKISIGPYELFSSIIGGIPIIISSFLIYNPNISFNDILIIISKYLSLTLLTIMVISCYIFGGLLHELSWKYFKYICKILKIDYTYLGNKIVYEIKNLDNNKLEQEFCLLEFEDRLIKLIVEKIGMPQKAGWITDRLMPYLRKYDLATASKACILTHTPI